MNLADGLNLVGLSSNVQMGTTAGTTPPLAAGVYAVWAPTQNAYIGPAPSTALTATSGYPIIANAAPIKVTVPKNGQIGVVSSSSGLFVYQNLG